MAVITHNVSDFAPIDPFGIKVFTPGYFLKRPSRYEMSTLSLRLPESIHRSLKTLADREGISINQLINSAVAEKLAALMTEEYLEQRARQGSKRKLKAILAKVPNVAPNDRDQMPPGLTRRRKKTG